MTVIDPIPVAVAQTGVIDTMDRPVTVTVTITGDRAQLTIWREGYEHHEYRLLLDRSGCAALQRAIHDARLQLGGTA